MAEKEVVIHMPTIIAYRSFRQKEWKAEYDYFYVCLQIDV